MTKQIRLRSCVALLLLYATTFNSSMAQQSVAISPKVTTRPPSSGLKGKPPLRWNIPRKFWTNTRRPLWLGGLRGHITVIEFFRINCSHCQEAAPSRRALYRKYRGQGLKMVGFQSPGVTEDSQNSENNWKQVQRTIRGWHLTYPIAFDQKRSLFNRSGLTFYPTIIVLDRKGVVRFEQMGYSEDKAKELDQFVAKSFKSSS